jgi:hypothetical protein
LEVIVSTHEKEHWRELCEQVAKAREKDPEKLQPLVEEIVRITEPQRRRPSDNNSGAQRDEYWAMRFTSQDRNSAPAQGRLGQTLHSARVCNARLLKN